MEYLNQGKLLPNGAEILVEIIKEKGSINHCSILSLIKLSICSMAYESQ